MGDAGPDLPFKKIENLLQSTFARCDALPAFFQRAKDHKRLRLARHLRKLFRESLYSIVLDVQSHF